MSSSYCWKLRALIKKNLILMKRNILSTLFEILFPIILFAMIIALREAFQLKPILFQNKKKTQKIL